MLQEPLAERPSSETRAGGFHQRPHNTFFSLKQKQKKRIFESSICSTQSSCFAVALFVGSFSRAIATKLLKAGLKRSLAWGGGDLAMAIIASVGSCSQRGGVPSASSSAVMPIDQMSHWQRSQEASHGGAQGAPYHLVVRLEKDVNADDFGREPVRVNKKHETYAYRYVRE